MGAKASAHRKYSQVGSFNKLPHFGQTAPHVGARLELKRTPNVAKKQGNW